MASVEDWSTTPASNTTLGGISTDGNITLVNQIDNIIRGMMAEVATSRDDGTIINVYPRGYLHGLTLSNNSGDATNDIDIAAGECVTLDTPYWRMALASALTKRLDAAWAVGTGNGGLDTGSIANTTYHIWLIARSDTGVVDALFSTSPTSPTMPANYDRKRRIGSIVRLAGAIKAFSQNGDEFLWKAAINDVAAVSVGTTAQGLTHTVPTGIKVNALFNASIISNTAGTLIVFNSFDQDVTVANTPAGNFHLYVSVNNLAASGWFNLRTNTSGQTRVVGSSAVATCTLNVSTWGYIDPRGRI